MTLIDIVVFIAVFILFVYAMPLLQFLTLLYYSYRYTEYEVVSRESVELSTLEMMKPAENFLRSKGFRYIAMLQHRSIIIGNSQLYHIAYYYHDQNGVHAFIKTQPNVGALEPVIIHYRTYLTNGQQIETVNGIKHFIQIVPKNITLYDHYFTDIESVYEAHLKAINSLEGEIEKTPLTIENIAQNEVQEENDYLKRWEKEGLIKIEDKRYRFRPSLATWRFALNAARKQSKYAKKIRLSKKKHSSLTVDGEIQALLTQLDIRDKPRGHSNQLLWFLISAVIFVILFALLGFSLLDIAILIVVLLIHEMGHFLAMRFFGYRDTNIFFLPFGAVTIGKKELRKAYEEYIVLLAGPLPGILIGIGLLIWLLGSKQNFAWQESPFITYALMSITINYLNLLPIYPFDGGRILQLLLLQRYPKGQFYFYVIGLLILTVAMIWLRDPLLLILAGIMVLGLKQSWRISLFMSKLYRRYKDICLNRDIVVREMIEDDSMRNETLQTKANIAKQVLYIIQTSKPSRWFVVLAISIYMILLIPFFIMIFYYYAFISQRLDYSERNRNININDCSYYLHTTQKMEKN